MEANSKEVIYYSLDSYKSNYSNNLKLFLDKFNEANEYDFVSREINDYKNYLLKRDTAPVVPMSFLSPSAVYA